ncbi:1-deoxy-D-xylulose 5-phosphate reductoisomerase [Clostridia bacterium]|nr:1-deoxy-D-xylulose 5-phosphate reductoisomerase [Clostridia bacterium]
MSKTIALLGSTGSIGVQSLDVIKRRGYCVSVLTANSNIGLLEKQAREFLPRAVAVNDKSAYPALKANLADTGIKVMAGRDAICEAAAMPADTVINAVVGIAGLRPALAALEAGNRLALANKESLIAGGELVMAAAKRSPGSLVPIDSEHSAIWQCLNAGRREDVSGIILTASGGPFFGKSGAQLAEVTVEQALKHPNWDMGAKITIDSATLMNKGLEFIEAMWLFDLAPSQIEIVVHRQSVIHSAVCYRDSSVIAQLGIPDMRGPIQYALTCPARPELDGKKLSLTDYGSLTFEKPDPDTFLCLAACIKAADRGGLSPCVANGANEQAVSLFLGGKISFPQIGEAVMAAVEGLKPAGPCSLPAIEAADRAAREFVLTRGRGKGQN